MGRGGLLLLLSLLCIFTLFYCLANLDAGGPSLRQPKAKVLSVEVPSKEGAAMRSPLLPLTMQLVSAMSSSPWTWTCDPVTTFCSRELHTFGLPKGEASCRASCAPATLLWPAPTSSTIGQGDITSFNLEDISVVVDAPTQEVKALVEGAVERQLSFLSLLGSGAGEGAPMVLAVEVRSEELAVAGASESYTLAVRLEAGQLRVEVSADTYFGARHGIETLFQLSVWDVTSASFVVPSSVQIEDGPYFPHRGVMLDTARNFVPVTKIKELINSLSFGKMNVLHWHITDSQSYPLVLPSLPGFAAFGAYREDLVYTTDQVQELVIYARDRGVQIIPELDAPAHVGAGWQAADPALTVCVNREPWTEWCVEPPCGQLNPTVPELYDVLQTMYGDWIGMFQPATFHVGGDEVHLGCWNSTPSILSWLQAEGRGTAEDDFMFLWHHFIQQSTMAMKSAAKALGVASPKLTLWSNQLTHPEHIHYLNKEDFTIQLWSDSTATENSVIRAVAEAGFKMVFSNYDATYLDCGFGAWVGNGHNWCSPYKQWQAQHANDPLAILKNHSVNNLAEAEANVLGGEVALWTEQADGASMMSRIEPRASAYGERLWRGPATGHWVEAERRLVNHRERIAARGVQADSLTHGWCRQNEGKCILEDGMGEAQNIPIF